MNIKNIEKTELELKVKEGLTRAELCSYFKINVSTLRKKLRKFKIQVKRAPLPYKTSKEKEDRAIELYLKGNSTYKVGKIIDLHQSVVFRILKDRGIKTRSKYDDIYKDYNLKNKDFFKKIDSEIKAYFLGLLAADGCLFKRNYNINLSLKKEEDYLLKIFSGLFYSEPKTIYQRKNGVCVVNIYNKDIYNDILFLGLTDKKSATLKFPTSDQVPDHLIHHFIRGYFDGDGCITYGTYKNTYQAGFQTKGNVNIVGSRLFILELKEKLSCFIKTKINIHQFKHSLGCYRLLFSHLDSVKKFYDFIYKDASIFMERKNKKFLEYFYERKN